MLGSQDPQSYRDHAGISQRIQHEMVSRARAGEVAGSCELWKVLVCNRPLCRKDFFVG